MPVKIFNWLTNYINKIQLQLQSGATPRPLKSAQLPNKAAWSINNSNYKLI